MNGYNRGLFGPLAATATKLHAFRVDGFAVFSVARE